MRKLTFKPCLLTYIKACRNKVFKKKFNLLRFFGVSILHYNDFLCAIDVASKFYNCVKIFGWIHHPNKKIVDVRLLTNNVISEINEINLPHLGVSNLGKNKGFSIQILFREEFFPSDSRIVFFTDDNETVEFLLQDLINERLIQEPSARLSDEWMDYIRSIKGAKILDVGGRSRSGLDRKTSFPNADIKTIDILEGENVDIVGDAHELSKYVPHNSLDAIYSVSVFEHIFMPWKVALEMNKVLKIGGTALIHSHQSIGIHDAPWDFWRFSDEAWKAIFNSYTGFEIVRAEMGEPQFLVPMRYRNDKFNAERSCGFESSTVWIKKTHDSSLSWDVNLNNILNNSYPKD